jgi:type II secretory pathway predicted ATPase ExeA
MADDQPGNLTEGPAQDRAEDKQVLGLAHNPFVSPAPGFFEGGDRKTYLEQLRHLSQWSRRVLLVTGPHDAGKSVLYRRLSASLEPRAKAARISGALINSSREVLAGIVQGFGLAAPADAHVQLLMDVIVAHVDDQQNQERFCVILVDDAELLDGRAVEQLLTLVSRCPIRVLLFAEVRIVPVVERMAKRLDVGWHELRLSGFDPNDVREYLEWHFKQARYRGRLPFSEQQVKDIARLSDGMPGRINQMASVLLARLQSGDLVMKKSGFPMVHRALLALLVLLILVGYLLWQPDRESAGPLLMEESVTSERTLESEQEDQPSDVLALTRQDAARADAPQAEDPQVAAFEESAVTAERPPESVAPDVTEQDEVEAPAAAAPASPLEGAVAAAPVPAPAPQTASADGPRDSAWILAQPADRFTLQLLSSSSAERASAYVEQRSRPQDFAIYRLLRDGKFLHVVIYGNYGSRGEAERAATSSEATAGGVKPWIRPFKEVQGAVRTVAQ